MLKLSYESFPSLTLPRAAASSLALLPPSWLLQCFHAATRVIFRKSRECAHTYTHAHAHTRFWLKPSRSFPSPCNQNRLLPALPASPTLLALSYRDVLPSVNRSRLLSAWGFHTVGTLLPQVCGRFIIRDSPRCYSFRVEAVPRSFAV